MPPLLKQSAAHFARELPPLLTPLYNAKVGPWQVVCDGEYLCGSAPEAEVRLEISGIEPQHCLLTFSQQTLWLTRISRRVWVNELPVKSQVSLQPGDVVSLGSVSFRIDAGDPFSEQGPDADQRPRLLGDLPSPNVTYVGHSDQRFTEAFSLSRREGDSVDAAALADIREQELKLLRRESELEYRETSLAAAEEHTRQLQQDLLTALHELEQQHSELRTSQQSLQETQASLQCEQQRLLHEAEALQQERATLADFEAQRNAATASLAEVQDQLKSALITRDDALDRLEHMSCRIDTLTRELHQSSLAVTAQTQRAELLQSELQSLEGDTRDDQQSLLEQQYHLQARQQQLEQEWSVLRIQQREFEQARLNIESQARGLDAAAAELKSRSAAVQDLESHAQAIRREAESLRENELQHQTQLHAKHEELQLRQVTLERFASELSQQQQQILAARKDAETVLEQARRREVEIQAQARQISAREQDAECRNAQLAAMQSTLEVQQSELAHRQRQLEALELAVHQREQVLTQREQELDQSARNIPAQGLLDEFEIRQQHVSSLEQELTERALALQERETELKAAQQSLLQQSHGLEQREQDVEARAAEVTDRISEWRHERRQQSELLAAKELQLSLQQQELQAATALLKAGQKDLNALQQRLATANEQLEIRRQLLQEQQDELTTERDHAIAELTSSKVMIVELRNALEQARSKNAVTAELKARLAEQDALINHLNEVVTTSREELVRSREHAEHLSQLAAAASRTPAPEGSELLTVIAARDALIQDLQTQLRMARETTEQEVDSIRRTSLLQLEQQTSLQKQLMAAEKGLRDRDVLIRELRNHLAAISGRQQPPVAAVAATPVNVVGPEEPLDDSPDDVISNLNSSDFFINLGAAKEPSITTHQTSSASSPGLQRDQFLELDVDHPDDEPSATEDDFLPSMTGRQPEYNTSQFSPQTNSTGSVEHVTGIRNVDLQTPGVLSAELISLLEMDLSLNKPQALEDADDDLDARQELAIAKTDAAAPGDGSGIDLTTNENSLLGNESQETNPESPSAGVPTATQLDAPSSDSIESEQAVRVFMEQLLSNRRGGSSITSDSGDGAEGERNWRSTGSAAESVSGATAFSRTESPSFGTGRGTQISFIERYMSGELQLGSNPDASAPADEHTPASVDGSLLQAPAVILSRPRTDLRKLRDDMQSIRHLATHVAEQAIIHHTLQQQASGLLPRAAVVVGFLAVLVWLKPWLLVWIQQPLYVEWGTLALLLISCLELFRKLVSTMLQRRDRTNLRTRFHRRRSIAEVQPHREPQQDVTVDSSDDAPIF